MKKKFIWGLGIVVVCFLIITILKYRSFRKENGYISIFIERIYNGFVSNYRYFPENIQQLMNYSNFRFTLDSIEITMLEKYPYKFIVSDSGTYILRSRKELKEKKIHYEYGYNFFDYIMGKGDLLYCDSYRSLSEWIWSHHPHSSVFFKNTHKLPDEEKIKLRGDFVNILKVNIEHDTSAIFYKSLIHYNPKEMKIVEHEDSLKNTQFIDVLLKEIHEQSKQLFKQYEVDSAYFFLNFPNKFELKQR